MFKSILVPVDLSDNALTKSALEAAKNLAALTGAKVRLVYVTAIVPSTYLEYVPADFESGEKARVEQELAQLSADIGLPEARVSHVVRQGGVYHEVLAEAESWKADVIVTSSHWPTLVTYLVGSHATNIVRHAHCSVLVIRS